MVDGKEVLAEAGGDGVVDACYSAIKKATGFDPRRERYQVKAITGGTDAIGEVSCLISAGDVTVRGHGGHTDIVVASAYALIDAMNRYRRHRGAAGERVVGP